MSRTVTMQFGKPGELSSGGGSGESGGGLTLDLLWTNPNPSSNFGAQTISIVLSNYSLVLIEQDPFNNDTLDIAIGLVGSGMKLYCLANTNTNRNGARNLTVSSSGITFSACTYNGATNNGYCIPLRIFGIR